MNWARRWLIGILLVSAICSTSCAARVRYIYRPANDQVFLIPAGAEIIAPSDQKIITDGATGRIQLDAVRVSVPSILISEDRLMELFRKVGGNGVDNSGQRS